MTTGTATTSMDELLGAQTMLADAIEQLQQAQEILADATVAIGEKLNLL